MSSEKLRGGYNRNDGERSGWKAEREQDLARKRRIGELAVGLAAMTMIGVVLSHSAKTSEIMNNEERAKNVKKIEVEEIVFHDGVNVRTEPFVDNVDPNQLASIGNGEGDVVVDYNGEGYYYNNEDDANGGWYGFDAMQLSDELLQGSYISTIEAEHLKGDDKYGDGTVWLNEKYVTVIEPDEMS